MLKVRFFKVQSIVVHRCKALPCHCIKDSKQEYPGENTLSKRQMPNKNEAREGEPWVGANKMGRREKANKEPRVCRKIEQEACWSGLIRPFRWSASLLLSKIRGREQNGISSFLLMKLVPCSLLQKSWSSSSSSVGRGATHSHPSCSWIFINKVPARSKIVCFQCRRFLAPNFKIRPMKFH